MERSTRQGPQVKSSLLDLWDHKIIHSFIVHRLLRLFPEHDTVDESFIGPIIGSLASPGMLLAGGGGQSRIIDFRSDTRNRPQTDREIDERPPKLYVVCGSIVVGAIQTQFARLVFIHK